VRFAWVLAGSHAHVVLKAVVFTLVKSEPCAEY